MPSAGSIDAAAETDEWVYRLGTGHPPSCPSSSILPPSLALRSVSSSGGGESGPFFGPPCSVAAPVPATSVSESSASVFPSFAMVGEVGPIGDGDCGGGVGGGSVGGVGSSTSLPPLPLLLPPLGHHQRKGMVPLLPSLSGPRYLLPSTLPQLPQQHQQQNQKHPRGHHEQPQRQQQNQPQMFEPPSSEMWEGLEKELIHLDCATMADMRTPLTREASLIRAMECGTGGGELIAGPVGVGGGGCGDEDGACCPEPPLFAPIW